MRITTLMPMLLLAACNGGGDDAGNDGAAAATGVTEPTPEKLMDDPQNNVVPIAPPPAATATATATAFPVAYLGRWGLGATDCEPGRDDAKGLMTVTPDRLAFYESRATPTRIAVAAPGRLVVDLAYTGEGQAWTKRETLALQDDGRTLVRGESDPAASLRYGRCPA